MSLGIRAYRDDCHDRAKEIMNNLGDVSGKSLIDIGCHNGFFMGKFLEAGGKSAIGIEPMPNVQDEAQAKGLNVIQNIEEVKDKFDVGFYLDLHYHNGINYIPWLKENVELAYISPSGYGKNNNDRLVNDLLKDYCKIDLVYSTPYADRNIYRCER